MTPRQGPGRTSGADGRLLAIEDPEADLRGGHGYRLGVVGNQPEQTEELLRSLDVGLELIASSATLGVPKPEPAFFEAIVERLGLDPAAIAYVGDRVDNDIAPAAAIGMRTILVRRGPWAWIQSGRADPPMADAVIEDLRGLPAVLAALTGG